MVGLDIDSELEGHCAVQINIISDKHLEVIAVSKIDSFDCLQPCCRKVRSMYWATVDTLDINNVACSNSFTTHVQRGCGALPRYARLTSRLP